MFLPVPTARDILVFQQHESYMTVAADTLGGIGRKPADAFSAPAELCGRMTARVCLMETLAVGAHPFALMALTCNEREPTGAGLLTGIREELAASGYPGLFIGGSTEDNMPTPMTAMGITLLGECPQPAWRLAQQGDAIYLFGIPYVGEEVIVHLEALPSPLHIQQLRNLSVVGDVIPCGSRGIAWELSVLEKETGLQARLDAGIDPSLLKKSAGPATCALVTARKPLTGFGGVITRLGVLKSKWYQK
jgi:hypothetical protein